MKRKILLLILFVEAALLAAFTVLTKHFPNLFSSMMAFPFEQIAGGLGFLSKAGAVGNGIAAALWVGISAVPAVFALCYKCGKETLPERIALYVLSGVILPALYGMVNPHIFRPVTAEGFSAYTKMIKAALGVAVWAVVVLYIVLRLIRLFQGGNKEQLLKYMRKVLYALCVLFTATAAVALTDGFLSLRKAEQTDIDRIFGVLRIAAGLIPYVFDIAIIIRALDLLGIAAGDEQEGIAEAAERVSRISCAALGFTTAITAASNIIRIAAMRWLSDITVTADIPIVSIVFSVMILLFSRLLIENKRLRDDNSLFI